MKIDYGPLKSFFESEEISEIMINKWNKIFVEHKGMLIETSARFVDERQYQELIFNILSFDKKNISSALSFDGLLPSGHRYNLTLPPMSPTGAVLTIRKFKIKNFTLADLVEKDFISENAAHFLKLAIDAKLNIIVSGGTGTGKTSFLNCLGSLISKEERIVSIEDVAELRLSHPNWISLQAVQEPQMNVSVRQCLTNALRMRPNRIIVGECRKDEAFEMLQAMNTGHDGSLTTIHANSAIDGLARLESLIGLAGIDLPHRQIRNQIATAVDLVIQLRRLSNGQRQVSEIMELTGLEGDIITRSVFFQRNKLGQLATTGYVPQKLRKINIDKLLLHPSFFEKDQHQSLNSKKAV